MTNLLLAAQTSLPTSAQTASADAAHAAAGAPPGLDAHDLALFVTIFALSLLVGVELITKVPPTLHTPLMSGSNAISGITVLGALVAAGSGAGAWATILGTVAVALAMVNVVGGFLVTHRMLRMFRRRA